MSERKRLLVLVLIMGCVAVITTGISVWVLYQAAFDEERARLMELVQSQARLIEAVARFDAEYSQTDHPEGAAAATLGQVVEANKKYQGFGETGEFELARREGDSIVFLLEQRAHPDDHVPAYHSPAVPFDSDFAEPMRRALSGQSGTMIGTDYHGDAVLAAYEPVAMLNLGIVARIDLAEVRAPFKKAGILSGLGAVLIILLGVPFLRRVFNPVVERLEDTVANLADAQRIAHLGNWDWNIVTNELRWSDEIYRIFGLEPREFGASYEAFLNSVHPDDRKMVQEAVDGALNDNAPYSIDHRIVLPSGEERSVHEDAEVTFDEAGRVALMAGTVQDITERKHAEEALQEKTELIQLLQTIAVAANKASSVDEAMQVCIDNVCAHTGWPVGHVYILSEGDAGDLASTKLWHLDHPEKFKTFQKVTKRIRFARGVGLPGRVLQSGEPAWIVDVTKDSNFPRAKLAEDIGVKAGFAFPVLAGKEVVAVLEFFSEEAVEPIQALLEIMGHVGVQLGRVIEREQSEAASRASEARFRDLFEHSPIAIWEEDFSAVKTMIDELAGNGVRDFHRYFDRHPEAVRGMVAAIEILNVNQATLDIYGAAGKDEFIRFMAGPHGRVAQGDFPGREFAALAAGESRFESEDAVRTLDGSEIVAYSITHIDDAHKDSWSRVITSEEDVTERKRAEAQLQQAQKMEAVGNLSGGIAHDFNNLLTIILGNLQLLERRVEGDEKSHKRVRAATDAALRGAELTKRLLAFSRRQVLEPKVVDVTSAVSNMNEMLRRTLGEAISIKTVIGEGLWLVRIDPTQFETALLNLAINARDAMPDGGRLTIELANTCLDDKYLARHPYVTNRECVMLAVSDTGDGMPREVIEQALEPFFTTKERGRGTGLGLSMVYGFSRQSGGHVQIYSEVGHGTTVKMYLPRSRAIDAAAIEEAAGDEEAPGGSETILVVEDDSGVRETAVTLLESIGYGILQAEDGAAALTILEERQDIDLLFSDVVMPGGMTGPELARKARDRRPDLKVLLTSGYTENAAVHDGLLDDDTAWLGKPYQHDELARKVRRVLDSGGRKT